MQRQIGLRIGRQARCQIEGPSPAAQLPLSAECSLLGRLWLVVETPAGPSGSRKSKQS